MPSHKELQEAYDIGKNTFDDEAEYFNPFDQVTQTLLYMRWEDGYSDAEAVYYNDLHNVYIAYDKYNDDAWED